MPPAPASLGTHGRAVEKNMEKAQHQEVSRPRLQSVLPGELSRRENRN